MKDILMAVYRAIEDDEIIDQYIEKKNIKFNHYPNVMDTTFPFIVIDDIDDPMPTSYADGDEMAYEYTVQVDVIVKYSDKYNARLVRNIVADRVQHLLWKKLKLGNVSSNKPEYLEEFKTYRSARVYEGIFYKEEN